VNLANFARDLVHTGIVDTKTLSGGQSLARQLQENPAI